MPASVIKVWGLPNKSLILEHLYWQIVFAMIAVTELGCKGQDDIAVFFPSDMMSFESRSELVIEISNLPLSVETSLMSIVRQRIAESIGKVVQGVFSKMRIECYVQSVNPDQGYWSSSTPSSVEETLTTKVDTSGTPDCSPCETCGTITVRSGTVYKCLNCGASMGSTS